MHVNHKRKALFFHVPKTGGTAIHTAFSHYKITNKDKWEFYLGMNGNFTDLKRCYETKRVFDKLMKYWKFCFVRNPWAHAVSLYFNLIDSDRWEKEDHPEPIENYKTSIKLGSQYKFSQYSSVQYNIEYLLFADVVELNNNYTELKGKLSVKVNF